VRLPFLKNYRRILPAALAACFALGFVAGAWIGPAITGTVNRRTAADGVPPAQSVSSSGIAPAQDLSSGSLQAEDLPTHDHDANQLQAHKVSDTPAREPETMIAPVEGRTVGAYGWYRDSVMDDWRFRDGLDISCVSGTMVAAALSGSVTDVARAQNGGYSVSLKHAGGVKTTYANLRAVWVEAGQQVEAGKPLGDIGAASSGSGGVVRFTVECDGESKDPAVCLGQRF
jgi:murein DD-endopeptidase MepM/ murein hydrolase activator NlpD